MDNRRSFYPAPDKISADNINMLAEWSEKYGVKKHFKYGLGQYGICHTLSHEEALVLPGEVCVEVEIRIQIPLEQWAHSPLA